MKGLILKTTAAAFAVCFVLGGCGKETEYLSDISAYETDIKNTDTDDTVIKVGEKELTLSMLRVYLLNYQNIYGKMYGADVLSDSSQAASFTSYVKNLASTTAAKTAAMALLAEDEGIELSAQMSDAAKTAASNYYSSLNETELEYTGISEDELVLMYSDYLLANAVYDKLTENVDTEVSKEDAAVMHGYIIRMASEDILSAAKKELKNGTDFYIAALEYGEDEDPEVYISSGDYPDEVVSEALNLTEGETSEAIECDGEYYLLYCLEPNDEKLSEEKREQIIKNRKDEAFDEIYEEFTNTVSSRLENSIWNDEALIVNDELKSDLFFDEISD